MATFTENFRDALMKGGSVNNEFNPFLAFLKGGIGNSSYTLSNGKTIERDVPNLDESKNSYDWKNRLAIPFYYDNNKDGSKTYGIMYIPEYNLDKTFDHQGNFKLSDNYNMIRLDGSGVNRVSSYGAELMDGRSLTTDGLRNLLDDKNITLHIAKDLIPTEDKYEIQKTVRKGFGVPDDYSTFKIPGVKVEDSDKFNRLRQQLVTSQENTKNSKVINDFIKNLRNLLGGK